MTDAPRMTVTTRPRPPAIPVETAMPFSFVHINKCGGSSVEIALGIAKRHATAKTMRDEIGAEAWAARYTFALVRNPFARVASLYYYRVRTDQARLADRHLSFNAWVARVWGARDPDYVGAPMLTLPCTDWLHDGDACLVEYTGRLETLDRDWAEICARLGVSLTLQRTNFNAYPPYRAIFSAEARALIEDAFRSDLDLYDYDF